MGDNFHAVIAVNHILTRAYGFIVLFMVLMRVWKEKGVPEPDTPFRIISVCFYQAFFALRRASVR